MSRFVGRYKKGEHSHNSSFTSDVTADSALSEGLTAVYRNDPRLGAILSRARLLAGEASFRHETQVPYAVGTCFVKCNGHTG